MYIVLCILHRICLFSWKFWLHLNFTPSIDSFYRMSNVSTSIVLPITDVGPVLKVWPETEPIARMLTSAIWQIRVQRKWPVIIPFPVSGAGPVLWVIPEVMVLPELDSIMLQGINENLKMYSRVPYKRAGPKACRVEFWQKLNKRTGWNFHRNTRVQGKNWQFYSW